MWTSDHLASYTMSLPAPAAPGPVTFPTTVPLGEGATLAGRRRSGGGPSRRRGRGARAGGRAGAALAGRTGSLTRLGHSRGLRAEEAPAREVGRERPGLEVRARQDEMPTGELLRVTTRPWPGPVVLVPDDLGVAELAAAAAGYGRVSGVVLEREVTGGTS